MKPFPTAGAAPPSTPAVRFVAPVVRLQMRRNPRRREFFGARDGCHRLQITAQRRRVLS